MGCLNATTIRAMAWLDGKEHSELPRQGEDFSDQGWTCLLASKELDEFVIVNVAVVASVSLLEHVIDLFFGQLLTDGGHGVFEVHSVDQASAFTIEHLEGLTNFLFSVIVFDLLAHQGQELREINFARAAAVDFRDHALQLGVCGVVS